jgi:hypothetical protein
MIIQMQIYIFRRVKEYLELFASLTLWYHIYGKRENYIIEVDANGEAVGS